MKGNLFWFFFVIWLYYCTKVGASSSRSRSLLTAGSSNSSNADHDSSNESPSSSSSSSIRNLPSSPESSFYFLIKVNELRKSMKRIRRFPKILNAVVTDKFIENEVWRKMIKLQQLETSCKIVILISMENAIMLKAAKTVKKCKKLLSKVVYSFKRIIFPQSFKLNIRLIRCFNKKNIQVIKIKKRFGKFKFSKWEADIKALKFEGNYFFKSVTWLTSIMVNMKKIMNSKNSKEPSNPKQNNNFDIETLSSPTASSANIARGKVLRTSLWPGQWVLLFSDINYKDIVQFFFKGKASFLVNLTELNSTELQNFDAPLIFKLENADISSLTSSDNIMISVNEIKIQFAMNAFRDLEYVYLPREGQERIMEAFLDCGVSVIHSDFVLEKSSNWVNSNYQGFGYIDLSYNACELIRSIDKHFDQNPSFKFLSFSESIMQHGLPHAFVIKPEFIFPGLANRRELKLYIDRSQVFERSLRSSQSIGGLNFINKAFKIEFDGENGIDGSGLTREWFSELFKIIFNPDFGLFKQSEINQNVFYPNELAFFNAHYLEHFKFAGLMVGVAMSYPFPIGFQFAEFFLKIILGKPVKLHDLSEVDEGLYTFLCWLLDHNVDELFDEFYFTYEFDVYGEHQTVELKQDGANILLTNETKFEYIDLILRYVLIDRIQAQITVFLAGFHLSVSQVQFTGYSVNELERLISGNKEIDVNDWERNTMYSTNFNAQSVQVIWFWTFLRTLDQSMLRKLLQFTTGSSSVPASGFKALRGRDGAVKHFEIARSISVHTRLPYSKTCYNMIVMPEYKSYEELVAKFTVAVTEGTGNFALG